MKAAVNHTYGLPDVISVQEVAKPEPKDSAVLPHANPDTLRAR